MELRGDGVCFVHRRNMINLIREEMENEMDYDEAEGLNTSFEQWEYIIP